MQAFYIKKNRNKVDVVKKAMEQKGNERVFVAFWEAKTFTWE